MKGNLYVKFSRKNYQFGLRTYQHPYTLSQIPAIYIPFVYRLFELTKAIDP